MIKKAHAPSPNVRSVTPIDATIGTRLRQRRLALHISQEKLAEQLGISFQQVQKYEKGTNRVSSARLPEIARILGVEIAWFYGDGANPAAAGTAEATAMDAFMASHEGLMIAEAFVHIKNPKVRAAIASFVRTMREADGDQPELQAAE